MGFTFDSNSIDIRLLQQYGNLPAAFQRFVWEVLVEDYPLLIPFGAKGKDGAVDHITPLWVSDRVIVEVKHAEDGNFETAQKHWRALAKKLREQLKGPGPIEGQGQYAIWYQSRADKYIFVTSAEAGPPHEPDTLAISIKDTLAIIAEENPILDWLQTVSIEVLHAASFENKLKNNPHINFLWFPRTRPIGLMPIELATAEGDGFRSYLSRLPYYSLRKHLEDHPPKGEIVHWDEDSLFARLERGSEHGLVLTGYGGIGKTRLCREIGLIARQNKWTVLWANGQVNIALAVEALEAISPRHRVLVIFDYIELHKNLGDFANQVEALNSKYGWKNCWLANCRGPFYYANTPTTSHHCEPLAVSQGTEIGQMLLAYRRAVTRHILADTGLKEAEQLVDQLGSRPVFAAWLHYLHHNRPPQSRDEQQDAAFLSELWKVGGFGLWVLKHVRDMSIASVVDTTRDVVLLMTILPFPEAARKVLSEKLSTIHLAMRNNGWIEYDASDDLWKSVHDMIADQLVSQYLETVEADNAFYWNDAEELARSIGHHTFESAQVTRQRLYLRSPRLQPLPVQSLGTPPTPESEEVDGTHVEQRPKLSGASEELGPPPEIDQSAGRLAWTSTNDASCDDLIDWLENGGDVILLAPILERYISNSGHLRQTGRVLVAWLNAGGSTIVVEPTIASWLKLHGSLIESELVMTAWLNALGDGTTIQSTLEAWLQIHSTSRPASFLYPAWLKSNNDPEIIRDPLLKWIKRHESSPEAAFVYTAWLNASADKRAIKEPVQVWLKQNATSKAAAFVYYAWLDSGQSGLEIRDPISKWLLHNYDAPEARFVYARWLKVTADSDAVRFSLSRWLEEHSTDSNARHLFISWLIEIRDHELIGPAFLRWIELHGKTHGASYLYKAWLDAGGNAEFVRVPLNGWLDQYALSLEARFVYQAWLNATKDGEWLRAMVLAWLNQYAASLEASVVFQPWLDATSDGDAILPFFLVWLEEHSTQLVAQYTYSAWLKATGDATVVRRYIFNWLSKHAASLEASFLLRAWLSSTTDHESIQTFLLAWLEHNGTSEGAVYMFKGWLEAGGSPDVVDPFVLPWLKHYGMDVKASYLYAPWLKATASTSSVELFVPQWLHLHAKEKGATIVFRRWLTEGGDKGLIRSAMFAWLAEHGGTEDAAFIFSGWLEAGGAPSDIQSYACAWLDMFVTSRLRARFVTAWNTAGGQCP